MEVHLFPFLKKAEMTCQTIAHIIDNNMMIIELFGTLLKISTPNSSIFCPMATDTAQSTPIGIKSQIYFFITHRMLGTAVLNDEMRLFC